MLSLALLGVALAPPAGPAASGAQAVGETTPPDTTINFGPEGSTFAARPMFGYASNDPDAYFECSLDSGPFEFCGPATYESLEGKKGRLPDGPHAFSVRAVSEAGVADPSPAVASFIVDTDPPVATIVTPPGRFTRETRPTFTIRVKGASKFWCRIIGKGVRIKVPSCDGPTSFTSPRPLAEGTYELVVTAVDAAVNTTEDRVEFSVRTKPGPPPPPPDPFRGSTLYTGRGKGVKKVSFRLTGHKLIEASLVVIESCNTTGNGQGRRYRGRAELEEASPHRSLRVDRRGRFRAHTSDVWFAGDEFAEFVGKVTPRSIVGGITRESSESAPESGVFNRCHTGPFGGPMEELKFHARRR